MKPLQNHLIVTRDALLGKLRLDCVGLFMPGLKMYALSPKRQRITEKIKEAKCVLKYICRCYVLKSLKSIYQFSDPNRRQEQADKLKKH